MDVNVMGEYGQMLLYKGKILSSHHGCHAEVTRKHHE